MRKLMIGYITIGKKTKNGGSPPKHVQPVLVDVPRYIGYSDNLSYNYVKNHVKNPPSAEYVVQFVGEYCGISKPLWRKWFQFN